MATKKTTVRSSGPKKGGKGGGRGRPEEEEPRAASKAPPRARRPAAGGGTAAAGRAGRTPIARASKTERPRIKSSHDAPSRAGAGAGRGPRSPSQPASPPAAPRAGGPARRPAPRPAPRHVEPRYVERSDVESRDDGEGRRAGGDPRRAPVRASTSEIGRSVQPVRAASEARLAKAGPSSRRAPGRSNPPDAPSDSARELALVIAGAGLDKKAQHVEVLDVTGRVDYTDFLVVMTGTSDRHVNAIAQGIEEALSRKKIPALSVEGLSQATWVLLDYGDVVCHVFQEESRSVYDIEGLWLDARKVQLPPDGAPASVP